MPPKSPEKPGKRPKMPVPDGRFYEAEFPEYGEVVVVQVKRIVDMGAYVTLLEYNGKEAMMLLSELSKRRFRSVAKMLRVGRTETCMVCGVDKDKGFIDLSKKRVEPEVAEAKESAFAKAKAVHGLMWHVAKINHIEVEDLCSKVSWPLYKNNRCAFDALRDHLNRNVDLWQDLDFSRPGRDLSSLAGKLKGDIDTKLRTSGLLHQQYKLRAKVEVACSEYEGIDAIQEALAEGAKASTEACKVRIHLVAHPLFVLLCTCGDKEAGIQAIEEAIRLMEESIKSKGGSFHLSSRPEEIGNEIMLDEDSDSDSGFSCDSPDGEQIEGMGELDAEALEYLQAKTVDFNEDKDDDEEVPLHIAGGPCGARDAEEASCVATYLAALIDFD